MKRDQFSFAFDMSYGSKNRPQETLPAKPAAFPKLQAAETPLKAELIKSFGPLNSPTGHKQSYTYTAIVASVAYYSLGLLFYDPTDMYALHRGTPSPRCLFASDLLLINEYCAELPGGYLQYNPVRHSFSKLNIRPERASENPILNDNLFTWLLRLDVDRIAYIYGSFAIRLALLELGHVVEQITCLHQRLGMSTRVKLSGSSLAFPNLLSGAETPQLTIEVSSEKQLSPAVPKEIVTSYGPDLYELIKRRSSARSRWGVCPLPCSLNIEQVREMACYTLADEALGADCACCGVELYGFLLSVQGVEAGVYRFSAKAKVMSLVSDLPPPSVLGDALFAFSGFVAENCSVVFFIAGDLVKSEAIFKEKAYSKLNIIAGRLGQRLSLAAAAQELFARPSLSMKEAVIDRYLGLDACSSSAVYQLLVGKNRDSGFRLPLSLDAF